MKKKIMIGAFAALFLSVGIFAATTLTEKEQVSGLTLANIEAITWGLNDIEDGTSVKTCYTIGWGSSAHIITCESSTSSEKIYPCGSESYSSMGVSSMCTVKEN